MRRVRMAIRGRDGRMLPVSNIGNDTHEAFDKAGRDMIERKRKPCRVLERRESDRPSAAIIRIDG